MYRTLDSSIWDDPKIRSLDRDGKLLFVYLVTNRHSHVSGIYYLPPVLVEHEIGLKGSNLDTLWDTLSGLGLARFDQKTEVVWVCNMLRYQGRGEKNFRAAVNNLYGLHKSFLIREFLDSYPEVRRLRPDTVWDTLYDTLSGVGTQEQEQEQEQEQNKNSAAIPPENGESRPTSFRSSKPTSDDRRKPLIDFLFADYKERTGLSLAVPFKSGVKALTDTLRSTQDDPSYSLERLKSAWVALMEADDPFIQKQNPVRYFAQNLNALLSRPKPRERSPEPGFTPQEQAARFARYKQIEQEARAKKHVTR